MQRVDLDELERLEKAATPGPWTATSVHWGGSTIRIHPEGDSVGPWGKFSNCLSSFADHDLSAATRNALPAIIAELRAARECTYILKWASDCDALRNEDEDMADLAVEKLAAYAATKGDG